MCPLFVHTPKYKNSTAAERATGRLRQCCPGWHNGCARRVQRRGALVAGTASSELAD